MGLLLLEHYQKLLTPKYRSWNASTLMIKSHTPSPILPPLSSHILCSGQTSSLLSAPIPNTPASWLRHHSSSSCLPLLAVQLRQPPKELPTSIFCPSAIHLHTSAILILKKVNNAHPFLKVFWGMWHFTTIRIKSKLCLLWPTGPTRTQPCLPFQITLVWKTFPSTLPLLSSFSSLILSLNAVFSQRPSLTTLPRTSRSAQLLLLSEIILLIHWLFICYPY